MCAINKDICNYPDPAPTYNKQGDIIKEEWKE